MAANGRGNMRPAGRSPPFLAIGLFVALVILGFNYWSLSARNGEQANEIVLMESELRLVNAKKTSAEKRSEAISDKVNDLEQNLNQQKEVVANKVAELANVENEKLTFSNRVNELEIEVKLYRDEKLPGCEQEKAELTKQLELIKGDVEFHKNKPCDESSCQVFSKQSRDSTLEDIYKVAGAGPLISLYRSKGNLGGYAGQIAGLAAQVDQAPLQGGANLPQGQQPPQGSEAAQNNQIQPIQNADTDQGAANADHGAANASINDNQAPSEVAGSKPEDSNVKVENKEDADDKAKDDALDTGAEQPKVQDGQDGAGGYNSKEGQMFPPDQADEGNIDDKDNKDYDDKDEDYENEDEDAELPDDTLRVNPDNQDEDQYDYDDDDKDNADDDDYTYNEKVKELDNNENGIDEMFRRDRDVAPDREVAP